MGLGDLFSLGARVLKPPGCPEFPREGAIGDCRSGIADQGYRSIFVTDIAGKAWVRDKTQATPVLYG